MHADCLVKPRESVSPYTVSPPNVSCTYEDASPGRFDPVFSVPLPYSCLTLQSLLLRTLFLFSCRTLSAATSSARTSAAKAQQAARSPNAAYVAPASSSATEPPRYDRPASLLSPTHYGEHFTYGCEA